MASDEEEPGETPDGLDEVDARLRLRARAVETDPVTPVIEDPPAPEVVTGLADGYVVAGRFEIRGRIGAGGFGAVYRASDRESRSDVALKLLSGRTAALRARARREVDVAQTIRHRNVCRVHAHGDDAAGLFLVMELIDGQNLRQLIDAGELALDQRLAILEDIAEGLAAIHRANLVHRDLKPANVMVDTDGRGVVVDLGLTRAPSDDGEPTTAVGTDAYMAPEQRYDHEFGAWSDVYSLGVVAHELIAGRHPLKRYQGPAGGRTFTGYPEALGAAGALTPLGALVACARDEQIANRYQTAAEFLEAFRTARKPSVDSAPLPTQLASMASAHGGGPVRARRMAGGITVLLALLVSVLGAVLIPRRAPPSPAPSPLPLSPLCRERRARAEIEPNVEARRLVLAAFDDVGCPEIKILRIEPNLRLLGEALAADPGCVSALTLRATLYYELAHKDQNEAFAGKAASDVAAALKVAPNNPDAWMEDCRLKNFRLRMNDQTDATFDDALRTCEGALKVGGNQPDPRINRTLAFIHNQQCDTEAAIVDLEAVIDRKEDDVKAYVLLIQLMLETNRLSQAESRARELITLLERAPADEERKQLRARAYLYRAFALLRLQQYPDAARAFRDSLAQPHVGKKAAHEEAAAIVGLMGIAKRTGSPPPPESVRLTKLEPELSKPGSGDFADLLLLYSRADSAYARSHLDGLPPDGTCNVQFTRAEVLHAAGQDQEAITALRQCRPSEQVDARCQAELLKRYGE